MKKIFGLTFLFFVATSIFAQTPGSLDKSFGTNGIAYYQIDPEYNSAMAITIQNDGKIVLAGHAGASASYRAAFWRLNPDGTLDNSFGNNGIATINVPFSRSYILNVTTQADGKIVAAGNAFNTSTGKSSIACYRLNTDGSLDSDFGDGNGYVLIKPSDNSAAKGIKVLPDGNILLAGYAALNGVDRMAIAKLNPNGSLFTDFGDNGCFILKNTKGHYIEAMDVGTDGKIIGVGFKVSAAYYSDYAVARFNPDGSPDNSFCDSGYVDFRIKTPGAHFLTSVKSLSDGKILLGGHVEISSPPLHYQMIAIRMNIDGKLDNTFGENGVAKTNITNAQNYTFGIARQTDGKIILGGWHKGGDDFASYNFGLTRFNADGTLDTDFGDNGAVSTDICGEDKAYSLAMQPDGKIVLAGYSFCEVQGFSHIAAVRYNALTTNLDEQKANIFSVYPNPSNDFIIITQELSTKNMVIIYDAMGKEVYSNTIEGSSKIDISNLSKGIYLIQMKNGENIDAIKFVKE